MNYEQSNVYTWNGEDHEFHFNTSLPLSSQIAFVDTSVSMICSDDQYHSLLRDIIVQINLIRFFTDIDENIFTEGFDIIERFIAETSVIEILQHFIDAELLNKLNSAIDDALAYKTGIHKDTITAAIVNLLKNINEKVSGIDTSVLGLETVKEFMQKFQHSNLDAKSIVQEYLNSSAFNHEKEV